MKLSSAGGADGCGFFEVGVGFLPADAPGFAPPLEDCPFLTMLGLGSFDGNDIHEIKYKVMEDVFKFQT